MQEGATLTVQGCSAPPQPPWHTAATSVGTGADQTSLLEWTWWQTGPTHWTPGTPERERERERTTTADESDSCIQLSIFHHGNYAMDHNCCWSPQTQMWLGTLAGVSFKKCANEALSQQLFVRNWGWQVAAAAKCISEEAVHSRVWQHSCWEKAALSSIDFPLVCRLGDKKKKPKQTRSAVITRRPACKGLAVTNGKKTLIYIHTYTDIYTPMQRFSFQEPNTPLWFYPSPLKWRYSGSPELKVRWDTPPGAEKSNLKEKKLPGSELCQSYSGFIFILEVRGSRMSSLSKCFHLKLT